MFLRALDAFDDDALGLVDIAPAIEFCPFAGLKVFIMGEEMLDLLQHDGRHILIGHDIGIIRKSLVHGNAEQFLIAARIVFHHQHPDWATFDNCARDNRRTRNDQRIQRIASGQPLPNGAVIKKIDTSELIYDENGVEKVLKLFGVSKTDNLAAGSGKK